MNKSDFPTVLLIEDNRADADLLKESFSFLDLKVNLNIIRDGSQITDFLNENGIFTDIKKPDLIILDINLPGKNGFEILKEIRSENSRENLPVVIFTSSPNEEDIILGYSLRADAVFSKPSDFLEFSSVVNSMAEKYLK